MGRDDLIDNVEAQPALAVDNVSMGECAATTSKLLHAMLIAKTQRKALSGLRNPRWVDQKPFAEPAR
eukprot:2934168-Pyramimonas_sp.AAC.1